jgi:hypothetical protein
MGPLSWAVKLKTNILQNISMVFKSFNYKVKIPLNIGLSMFCGPRVNLNQKNFENIIYLKFVQIRPIFFSYVKK